jgi:phosphoadenylyl-sulfate reductase (thioredoxin)
MHAETLDLPNLETANAADLLRYAFERYGARAAIGTSLQKTGIVTIDIASRLGLPLRVFFIDTLLNHDETYALLEEVERRYGITVERFQPDPADLARLHGQYGGSPHFFSREECCRVRKTQPLERALGTLDVWIAGLRRDQSAFRRDSAARAGFIAAADGRNILKLNPLLDWTEEQVDTYAAEHGLPSNALYDYISPYGERYAVIGCRPCHVPVLPHFDKRMGKFPWEHGKKECGMHTHGGGI